MSFRPLQGGSTSEALLGTADPVNVLDFNQENVDSSLFEEETHSPELKKSNIRYTIILVIITAIVFVTIIAIYDVFRSLINSYVANNDVLKTNFWFALFCVVTGIILIWILLKLI